MEVRDRFLNFPVVLLRGFLDDHKGCLNRIVQYSVYEMVYSDRAKFDSLEDFMEEYDFPLNKDFIPSISKQGQELCNSCDGMNYPWTGIHVDTFDRFYTDRSQFDLVCLLAFLALKSIQQKKPYGNTKNPLLYSRMAGFAKTVDDIPEGTTYWMECESRRKKVFSELEKHYNLVRAYKSRGITFSINKLSQEELELAILIQKDKKSDKEISLSKQRAKEAAVRKFEAMNQKNKGQKPSKT